MTSPSNLATMVAAAAETVAKTLPPTPLLHSAELSKRLGCKVLLKLESEQPTGSFKIRGALNKYHRAIKDLSADSEPITFVAASSGNHALACCHCWTINGCRGEIFVPATVTAAKESKLQAFGFPLVKVPGQCLDAELEARRYAEASPSRVLMAPYNDLATMSGNGTFVVEAIAQAAAQNDRLDAIVVSVGGGGMIGAAAAFVKARAPGVRVIAAQPENDPVMTRSVQAGRILLPEEFSTKSTIAQGVAGSVEEGTVTFEPCRNFVDTWIECSEQEIARSTLELNDTDGLRVEASAGLALGALRRCLPELQGRTVVVCICGGNVDDTEWTEYERVASLAD